MVEIVKAYNSAREAAVCITCLEEEHSLPCLAPGCQCCGIPADVPVQGGEATE